MAKHTVDLAYSDRRTAERIKGRQAVGAGIAIMAIAALIALGMIVGGAGAAAGVPGLGFVVGFFVFVVGKIQSWAAK